MTGASAARESSARAARSRSGASGIRAPSLRSSSSMASTRFSLEMRSTTRSSSPSASSSYRCPATMRAVRSAARASGEAHGQVGVEMLRAQLGNGAPLLLQVLDLQGQFAVELVQGARGCRVPLGVHLVQNISDAREGKAQAGQALDAQHAGHVGGGVVAVPVGLPRRLGQKPQLVVVPQRAHGHARQFRHLVAMHRFPPCGRSRFIRRLHCNGSSGACPWKGEAAPRRDFGSAS